MRLLLTVDEGLGSLAAVRALRAGGYEPWIAVAQPATYAVRSRAAAGVVRVPDANADADEYAQALAAEARRLGVAAVLPGTEGTLRALTGREELFPGIALGTCSPEELDRATDKAQLEEFAREAGLETPPTVEVSAETLDARAAALTFPAVLKPVRSVSDGEGGELVSREVERVNSLAQLGQVLGTVPGTWLVQPYLEGRLAAICGIAWEGRLVCAEHQESLRIWPPGRGISCYAETVPRDSELEAGVARLLALVGWSGVFGIQFIRSGARNHLIDLNPRIYGSIALAIGAGLNLPSIWADLLLGRAPRVVDYRVGTRYRVEEDDVRAVLVDTVRRRRPAALLGLLPRRHTVHGIFSLRDPAPVLTTLAKVVGR